MSVKKENDDNKPTLWQTEKGIFFGLVSISRKEIDSCDNIIRKKVYLYKIKLNKKKKIIKLQYKNEKWTEPLDKLYENSNNSFKMDTFFVGFIISILVVFLSISFIYNIALISRIHNLKVSKQSMEYKYMKKDIANLQSKMDDINKKLLEISQNNIIIHKYFKKIFNVNEDVKNTNTKKNEKILLKKGESIDMKKIYIPHLGSDLQECREAGCVLIFQEDGNLVVYDTNGIAVLSSKTHGASIYDFVVHDTEKNVCYFKDKLGKYEKKAIIMSK